MQSELNEFTVDSKALHVLYFCGYCDVSYSSVTESHKCPKCKKILVKYFSQLETKSYVTDSWTKENLNTKGGLFKREAFAFFLILIGSLLFLIIPIVYFFKFFTNFSDNIDSDILSQMGDILGGVVGPLWALAGVVLFYKALQTQIKSSETNQELLLTQVSLLNSQLTEYRDSIKQTKKIAKANKEYNKGLKQQNNLLKSNLSMDRKAILLNAYSNLARVYDENNTTAKQNMVKNAREILIAMQSSENEI